jgi:hypothetical protein
MLTHPLVIRAYALRSVRLWLGLRGMTALFLAVNDLPPFPRSRAAVLFFVLVTTAVCFADVWVRHERALIGNLGMSLWTLAGVSALPPVLAEACFVAGVGLLS